MVFNGAQLHMLVNHLPVVGLLGMILALAVAIKSKSAEVKRLVLIATVVAAASAFAPYLTGESAEETVEHLRGVSKDLIHEHEELAEVATVFSAIASLAAGIAFYLERRRPETLKVSLPVVLILCLVSAGVMAAAAHAGGMIRHPELGPGAQSTE